MVTVNDFVRKLSKINVDAEAKQATAKTGKSYIQLNQEQMKHGLNAEGGKIGKYRNALYAEMKAAQNSLPGKGNVDLILTGTFIGSMEFDLDADVLRVEADDPNDLLKRYDNVFGLDDKSKDQYIDIVRPVFVTQIDSKL